MSRLQARFINAALGTPIVGVVVVLLAGLRAALHATAELKKMLESEHICTSCESELDIPVHLKFVNRTTMNKKLPVLMCQRCEGPAFELSQRTDIKFFNPHDEDNNPPLETA